MVSDTLAGVASGSRGGLEKKPVLASIQPQQEDTVELEKDPPMTANAGGWENSMNQLMK